MGFPLHLCLVVLFFANTVAKTQAEGTLFPVGSGATLDPFSGDGDSVQIELTSVFVYAERRYSQFYLNMNGFVAFFQPNPEYYPDSYVGKDMIAPLWADIENDWSGTVSYEQATSGPLVESATEALNQMFLGYSSTVTWVFAATWMNTTLEVDSGTVSFQVVLITDNEEHSYVLMNYEDIPLLQNPWLAGFALDNNTFISIPVDSSSDLLSTSNIGIPGRWVYSVHNGPNGSFRLFFPVGSGAVVNSFPYDGASVQIQLDYPFVYAGRYYTDFYLNMNGFVTFFHPPEEYYPDPHVGKNMIAPLWADIENDEGGKVSYEQATNGPLITIATAAINQIFQGNSSSAVWVFTATWEKTPLELDSGSVSFQVVLITDDEGHSYVLMNYGDIPPLQNLWLAGFALDNNSNFISNQAANSDALLTASNVGIPGRWAYAVDNGPNGPSRPFFPIGSGATLNPFPYDGADVQIQLDFPFMYAGKYHSQLYLNMDGYVSFVPFGGDDPYPNVGRDMIAPFWADIENDWSGTVSYEQATSGPLVMLATSSIHRMFPGCSSTATWVFTATWLNTPVEHESAVVSFQVVLIMDDDDISYALYNYGDVPYLQEYWLAGFALDNDNNFIPLPVSNSSDLPSTSNVGILGRWAFRVQNGPNGPSRPFFPIGSGATLNPFPYDGADVQIQLDFPFVYAGKYHSQLYLNMDGYVSFVPFGGDDPYPNVGKDMIAPFWADIENDWSGTVSYEQATSGPLVMLATSSIHRMFPGCTSTATWVFIATWLSTPVEYESAVVSFQLVLIMDDDDISYALYNYGDVPYLQEYWLAGFALDNDNNFIPLPVSNSSDLPSTSNVGILGRWAFRVQNGPNGPSRPFFPIGSGATLNPFPYDGADVQIQLDFPFVYAGKYHSQLYLNMDGYVSFVPFGGDDPYPNVGKDMIAPFWADIENDWSGTVSYEQATSGPLVMLATSSIHRMFPGCTSTATWVFIATWLSTPVEYESAVVSFQLVLIMDDDDISYALYNYGDVPYLQEYWLAGFALDNDNNFIPLPVSNSSDLPSTSNVGILGRWAFRVQNGPNGPSRPFFPIGSGATLNPFPYDGADVQIQLDFPFVYAGKYHSQLYLNMDGYVSFVPFGGDDPYPNVGKDMIAPFWADIENDWSGTVSYEQATSGPLVMLATSSIHRMFPGCTSTATWVFIATWLSTPVEYESAVVSFQLVLIMDDDDISYALYNYGDVPYLQEYWLAGFALDNDNNFIPLPVSNSSDLPSTSNVGILGRWAFRVQNGPNGPSRPFFPIGSGATLNPFPYDGADVQIQLDFPFVYAGKYHSQLYLNMDGYVSFVPFGGDDPYPNVGKDMIAPFWADIENDWSGTVSYEQATSGPLVMLATSSIHRMFPGCTSTATWVFIATWLSTPVEYESAVVSFQLVLIMDDDDISYALFNYGDVPYLQEYWLAGFAMDNNNHFISLPVSTSSALPSTSNVGLLGRWAYKVHIGPDFPDFFYPFGHGNVVNPFSSNGNSAPLALPGSFLYFGNFHTTLYINENGFQSFLTPFGGNNPDPNANADIIAPLWTNFSPELIYYQEVTNGSLLHRATAEINRMFPGLYFSASWLFITTWVTASYSTSTGVATFQTVLVSGDDISFLLMNYGHIAPIGQAWLSGYLSTSGIFNYTIGEPNPSDLSRTTNVGIPGRWAFRTDGAVLDTCDTLQCTENEVCAERSGIYGCNCATNNSGTNLNIFDSTETCSGSSGTVSLSRCQLFEAGYSAQFLHLNDPKCKGVIDRERVVFHFDNDGHKCGTVLTNNATHFFYENNIQAILGVGDQTMISRDNWMNIAFSCVYPLVQSISMPMVIQATGSMLMKDLPTEGTYQIQMLLYPDASFSTPYSGDVTLGINHQLFVAVEVEGVDSRQISTVLDSCWATPVNDKNYNIRWNLIVKECPNPEDGTVQVLQNGVTTSSRFSFRMFTFTSISDNIYVHCQVHLCLVESGECHLPCSGDSDRRRRRSVDFHDTATISMSF